MIIVISSSEHPPIFSLNYEKIIIYIEENN